MFAYARRLLTGRRSLWLACIGCATLVALIPPVLAESLAAPGVALLLSGDASLALRLAPETGPLVWGAAALALAAGGLLWCRLYSVALWSSDPAHDDDLSVAWASTARSWRKLVQLYLIFYGLLALVGGAILVPVAAIDDGRGTMLLGAVILLLLGRTVARVVFTHAARVAVFDGGGLRGSWKRALEIVRARPHDQLAAWMTLMAAGATIWLTGRLISPVVQETALAYRAGTGLSLAREAAQLWLAIPLEGLLLGLSCAVWTAVFRDEVGTQGERAQREREHKEPWLARALALLVVLAITSNGLATGVEAVYQDRVDRDATDIADDEIEPPDMLVPTGVEALRSDGMTSYEVDATLERERLQWTTEVTYYNDTAETLDDLAFNLYPAAYAGELRDIPLADDLLALDIDGELASRARPGTFTVRDVRSGSGIDDVEHAGTVLTVGLSRPLPPRGSTAVTIELLARMPRWPDRFGVWNDVSLLGNWIPTAARREAGRWRTDPFGSIGDPFFSGIADYEVSIDAPDPATIVGTGTLVSVLPSGEGRTRWRFRAASVRDAAYAVAPFLKGVRREVAGTDVVSWYRASDRLQGTHNLEAAVGAARFYAERFGRLPGPDVEVVETDGLIGGMEYPGVVFVSGDAAYLEGVPLLDDLARYAGFDRARTRYVVGHEMAHQWWYATVGSDQINEPWLDEGLAEASVRLWLEASADGRTWQMANLTESADPRHGVLGAAITDFDDNAAYSAAIYDAGGEILVRLADAIGHETFFAVLRQWYRSNYLSVGTVEGFIDIVEEVAGRPAADELRRYR